MTADRTVLWNRAGRHMRGLATALAVVLANVAAAAGPQEGVKVHGDWTIEVRNPDGTLVERRQFKNALVPDGASSLTRVLSRQNSSSFWRVQLGGGTGVGDPCVSVAGGAVAPCMITEAVVGNLGFPLQVSPNLTLTVPASGPNAGNLVLSGSVTASSAVPSSLVRVATAFVLCPPASVCGAGGSIPFTSFTSHLLQSPLTIAPGQIIQVTVVFSFS